MTTNVKRLNAKKRTTSTVLTIEALSFSPSYELSEQRIDAFADTRRWFAHIQTKTRSALICLQPQIGLQQE